MTFYGRFGSEGKRGGEDFNGGEEHAYFFTIVVYTPSAPNYTSV